MSAAETPEPARGRVLVTGAAVRVGLACACECARRGFEVVMAVRVCDDRAARAVETVRTAGGGRPPELVACDLANPEQVTGLGARLSMHSLDALVHCAAMYLPDKADDAAESLALAHYKVNALAPLILGRALRARLAESSHRGGGAIVLFSDMHAQGRFYSRHAGYFASKGAVDALVGALAVEFAPHVRVNGVAPGAVAWPEGAEQDMKDRYLARTPLARVGTPEEAAQCAAWLAFDAPFTTGQIVRVDGGRWLR